MKKFVLFLSSGLVFSATSATPGFIVNPVGQVTGSTCQSYALGVAMAFKRDAAFSLNTASELRAAEMAIRKAIEAAANGAPVSHIDIQKGFQSYTAQKYKLKFQDIDFSQVGDFVTKRSGISSAASVPPEFLIDLLVKDVALASATKIGNDTYKAGHIFTILGADGGPNSSQQLLILNSAIKVRNMTRNSCTENVPDDPGPYTAELSWRPTSTITFKQENGKVRIWTIEKN